MKKTTKAASTIRRVNVKPKHTRKAVKSTDNSRAAEFWEEFLPKRKALLSSLANE